jgi:hypothetical protein
MRKTGKLSREASEFFTIDIWMGHDDMHMKPDIPDQPEISPPKKQKRPAFMA